MDRRRFITSLAGVAAATAASFASATPNPPPATRRTRWSVQSSEGLDALCVLSPLSGDEFYARHYPAELEVLRPRLPEATLADIAALKTEASRRGSLLGPLLCLYFSGARTDDIGALLQSLDHAERRLQPALAASPYWSEERWRWFLDMRPRLRIILHALETAGFGDYWRSSVGRRVGQRLDAARAFVEPRDVIHEQERLLGRRLSPQIEVNLLHFSKPHGIKLLGQRFLTHMDYPLETIVRNAAHEMLHPPFSSDTPEMQRLLKILADDDLLRRVLAEHDPRYGYNTIEGYVDENVCQALEQIICERLGVAKDARARWREADDGMHILAAGIYGLLKQDGFDQSGGRIEAWLAAGVDDRLRPPKLHQAASSVLGVPTEQLWPQRQVK